MGNTAEAAGCSGTRSIGEAEEHEVVMMTSWFTGTVKQIQAGKQDHREEKVRGGQADPIGESPCSLQGTQRKMAPIVLQLAAFMC